MIQLSTEKFARKLLGESEIEAVLQRLDRLTVDEARMTGTETLQVVHGLLSNMKLVMNGTQLLLCMLSRDHDSLYYCSYRQQGIHGWTTTSFGYVHAVINVIRKSEYGWKLHYRRLLTK